MCGITTVRKRALASSPRNESGASEATNRIGGLSASIGRVLVCREITDMAPAPDRLQFGFAGAEQSSEILQLFRFEVGDRPIAHAIFDPPDHVVATNGARTIIELKAAFRRHCGEADKVVGTAINQCRDWCSGNYVNTSTDQREVVLGEIDDPRRIVDAAIE